MSEQRTLTVPQAAAELGVAASTLYRLIEKGKQPFPVLRVGSRWLVSRVILDRYLAGEIGPAEGDGN